MDYYYKLFTHDWIRKERVALLMKSVGVVPLDLFALAGETEEAHCFYVLFKTKSDMLAVRDRSDLYYDSMFEALERTDLRRD